MNSRNLTKRQAGQLLEDLRPMTAYLHRLQARMIDRGFPPGDPFLQIVGKAYDAMRDLLAEAHYMSCENIGRPRRD
jgi:hypothetical protein